ncbi:uncharacterized protein F4812DRAFT_198010 [Daldinia caldariorum]|uniref:uncharacterized protein n=1 Tax=Daldinia caldariorum TaxID=326644 RepID=UPI002007BCCC|nr:uncharacterized protein F4812DRAFT_198010 [Daldinia caldariorum]KAI1471897.1 hypothetical protein F4812DRAFT_198010 [Daldinia caldariorum]
MSYNTRVRVSGFEDERRRPYGGDSYKPSEERQTPRDHSRDLSKEFDRDKDRDRDRNMVPGQRDSADAKDTRSPRSIRRDMGNPKDLKIDTRAPPTGPRRTMSDVYSPASGPNSLPASSVRPTPTEPAAISILRATGQCSPIVAPNIPKPKDPKLQEVFEAMYKWNETSQERVLMILRRNNSLREDNRRRSELSKVANKVNDYAPYSEFQRRFDESRKSERDEVSTNLTKLDHRCAEDLERAVSAITSSKPQVADNTSLQALEARFAEFQKQSSEQQKQISRAHAQIETLRSDREMSSQAFNNLDKNFKMLKSDFNALQSENLQLKKQIADLDALKKTQDDMNRLSKDFGSFTSRVDDVEGKVATFMGKVEDLDMETYNEILGIWIDHDFKSKVFTNEKAIVALRRDFNSFQETAVSRFEKNDSSIQETRKLVEDVESSRPAASQMGNETPIDKHEQNVFIGNKLDEFKKVIEKTVTTSNDVCADMVDEVSARMDKVEVDVKTLGQLLHSKHPDMTIQINKLKQAMEEQRAELENLQTRLKLLENEGFDPKINPLIIRLAHVEEDMRHLQQSNAPGAATDSDAVMNAIKSDMEDAKKRFEALEFSIKTLDHQWANISTRQMAAHILQHLDNYGQRNESRIASVENEVKKLRDKLAILEHNLTLLRDPKHLVNIIKASPLGKRPASPASPAEDPAKKRKLDTKGQHTESSTTEARVV